MYEDKISSRFIFFGSVIYLKISNKFPKIDIEPNKNLEKLVKLFQTGKFQ